MISVLGAATTSPITRTTYQNNGDFFASDVVGIYTGMQKQAKQQENRSVAGGLVGATERPSSRVSMNSAI